MPEPIKFKHLIAEMAGGRDAIMAVAREENAKALAGGAAPTTKAMAVEHILEAIRMQVSTPLHKLLTDHVNAVDEEYELVEGSLEEAGVHNKDAWWVGQRKALSDALDGETLELIGADDLADWVIKEEPVEDLVTLILEKGIKDPANALAKCGITKEDIASLITPAPIVELRGATAAVAAEREVPGVKSATASVTVDPNAIIVEPFNTPYAPGDTITLTVAETPKTTRKRAPKIEGPTPVTAAAAAALEALIAHSAYKEADVAAALGVSRTQALNYRTGKTLWEPSDEQMGALRKLFDDALAELRLPLGALEGAWLE